MRPRRYTHLSADERETLSLGLAQGHSLRTMARVLGRAPSTMSREAARNAMRKAIGTLDDPLEETTLAEQLADLTKEEVTWILPKLRLFGEFLSSVFDFDKIFTLDWHEFLAFKQPMIVQGIEAYKARPLDGIWVTAPYLHNGSVPSLYELLLPPDQRTTRFCVGEREFDPIKVGVVVTQDCAPEKLLDTTIEGNHNSGHNYGNPQLTDEDRWALVEYQKALSDPSSERD